MAKRYFILDGERRWRAARLANIASLKCIVLPKKPSAEELAVAQFSIESHRSGLSSMEKSDFLQKTMAANGWSVKDATTKLNIKQPMVSKLLKLQQACPELRDMLHKGQMDMEKGYTICECADHDKQRELMKHAKLLERDQLRRKAHSNGQPVDLKTHRAKFCMPGGLAVVVQGPKMSLDNVIDVLRALTKELRQAQREHLDVVTASRVLADKAKVAP